MTESFVCCMCENDHENEEVSIQRCGHIICWKCLSVYVNENVSPKIKCPFLSCVKYLSDTSIRKVLSDKDVEKYEQFMFGLIQDKVKCMLPECSYIFIPTGNACQFDCPNCTLFNCLLCHAAHRFLSCSQYHSDEEAPTRCQEEIDRSSMALIQKNKEKNREMLKNIDMTDLFLYDNPYECLSCSRYLARGDIVILRCSHMFCRYCLKNHIKSSTIIPIPCPSGCRMPLEEREIMELLTEEELKIYFDRCTSLVKGKLGFTFHCQRKDCTYIVEYSIKPNEVYCPLCKVNNCVKCYSIHHNETCEEFKYRIRGTPEGINLRNIEEKIRKKEWMRCLKCGQILKKIAGCSWIQCSNCKFEMCWALQIRRWGPKGRGDTSGGCRCGVNGYCAPNCGSCTPHN